MYYKNEVEFKNGDACIQKFVLTGAESLPDVDVSKRKYALNIILPSSDETGEIRLLFENVSENRVEELSIHKSILDIMSKLKRLICITPHPNLYFFF